MQPKTFKVPNPVDSFAVFLFALAWTGLGGRILEPLFGSWSIIAFTAGLAAIPCGAAMLLGYGFRETFRLKLPRAREIAGGLALSSGMLIVALLGSLCVGALFPDLPASGGNFRTSVNDPNLLKLLVSVVILPAVCEEILFRGFVLSGIDRGAGRMKSAVFCGLLFGLLHLDPAHLPFTVGVGVGLSWVALKTGSIVVPVLMHGFHNFATLALARLALLPDFRSLSSRMFPAFFAAIVCLACAGGLIALGIRLVGRERADAVSPGVFPSRGPNSPL